MIEKNLGPGGKPGNLAGIAGLNEPAPPTGVGVGFDLRARLEMVKRHG